MLIKTEYQRALSAFLNFHKGFKGKISMPDVKETMKVFKKIKEDLVVCEEAMKFKAEEVNKDLEENKKDLAKQAEIKKAFEEELSSMQKSFQFELDSVQIELVKKVLNSIVFEEGELKDANTPINILAFQEDLESAE